MGVLHLHDSSQIMGIPIMVFDLSKFICMDQFLLQNPADLPMSLLLACKGYHAICVPATLLIFHDDDCAGAAFLCLQKMQVECLIQS